MTNQGSASLVVQRRRCGDLEKRAFLAKGIRKEFMEQIAFEWSIEPNVLYQVELEVGKRRDLGKSNISRKENIYRSVEAKVYEMYWETIRDPGYMQKNHMR